MDVVIPWRAEPDREPLFQYVRTWLAGASVHLTDVDTKLFNRAAARNAGVAALPDAEVIVVMDADTIVDPIVLQDAVAHVARRGGLALPYNRYFALTPAGTADLLAGADPADCAADLIFRSISGGVIVTTPEAWWAVGGQDERFQGWGYEDAAWRLAADTLTGVTVFSGPAYAGSHATTDKDLRLVRRNKVHASKYHQVRGKPDAMRKLTRDPARFVVTHQGEPHPVKM